MITNRMDVENYLVWNEVTSVSRNGLPFSTLVPKEPKWLVLFFKRGMAIITPLVVISPLTNRNLH